MSTQPSNSAHQSSNSLRIAVLADKESVVRELVKMGHDINSRDSKGSTALIIAARMNRSHICQVLLDLGGDPFIKNFAGHDALEEAEQAAAGSSAEIIASYILEHSYGTSEINSATDLVGVYHEDILGNSNSEDLKYLNNETNSDFLKSNSSIVTSADKVEFITTQFLSENVLLESLILDGTHSIEVASTSSVLSQIDFPDILLNNIDTSQRNLAHRQGVNRLKERALIREISRFHPFKSTSELKFRNQCLFQLIELAYSKNYLLREEILFAIPEYNLTSDMVEIVVSMFNEMGVAVYEHEPREDIIVKDNALIYSGQFEKKVQHLNGEAISNSSLTTSFEPLSKNPSIVNKYEIGESLKSELGALRSELEKFEKTQEPSADAVAGKESVLVQGASTRQDDFARVHAAADPIHSHALDTRVGCSLGPLIALGHNRGYVTHSDISEYIYDKPIDANLFDLLVDFLEDREIIVYERTPDFENLLHECVAAYSDNFSITSSEDQCLGESRDDGSELSDANRFE